MAFLQDLSSSLIPFDDDEEEEVEEEEETYDDIEGATTPPPPRPGPASAQVTAPNLGQTPQSSHEEWKDQNDEEDDEEDDIYEVLPGTEKNYVSHWLALLTKQGLILDYPHKILTSVFEGFWNKRL